jgi:photosystem II stability/assembly factor-like uncharacterized protein
MNGSTGYVYSSILHTDNGGNTWDYQYETSSCLGSSLYSVCFTDPLNGWSAGGCPSLYELILKTTDGGSTWDTAYFNSPGVLSSVYFINALNGWAVGNYGSIISTADGGDTWESESSGTDYSLKKIYFTENGLGWIVGAAGTILHADYSQLVGLDEIAVPDREIEVDCYPNPFTSSTTVIYELQQASTVGIFIYDILGRQLVKKRQIQPAGKQQIVWNTETLPEGIYFCQLQVGDRFVIKKLIKSKL